MKLELTDTDLSILNMAMESLLAEEQPDEATRDYREQLAGKLAALWAYVADHGVEQLVLSTVRQ